MKNHDNSIAAFRDIQRSTADTLRGKVLDILREHGPCTDRMLGHYLDIDDDCARSITPRVSELLRAGMIKEVGTTACNVSGRIVRVVDLTSADERAAHAKRMAYAREQRQRERGELVTLWVVKAHGRLGVASMDEGRARAEFKRIVDKLPGIEVALLVGELKQIKTDKNLSGLDQVGVTFCE